jgi:hypothetical protein
VRVENDDQRVVTRGNGAFNAVAVQGSPRRDRGVLRGLPIVDDASGLFFGHKAAVDNANDGVAGSGAPHHGHGSPCLGNGRPGAADGNQVARFQVAVCAILDDEVRGPLLV